MNDPCWGFPHNYSHVTEHDFKTTAIPFPFNSCVKFSTILCFIILSIIGCANDAHFKILAVNFKRILNLNFIIAIRFHESV